MNKIRVIEDSLRCFRYSLWSLIPLVGIVFAVRTFRLLRRVRAELTMATASYQVLDPDALVLHEVPKTDRPWNPAHALLHWAIALAMLGCLISLAALTICLIACWQAYSSS